MNLKELEHHNPYRKLTDLKDLKERFEASVTFKLGIVDKLRPTLRENRNERVYTYDLGNVRLFQELYDTSHRWEVGEQYRIIYMDDVAFIPGVGLR